MLTGGIAASTMEPWNVLVICSNERIGAVYGWSGHTADDGGSTKTRLPKAR